MTEIPPPPTPRRTRILPALLGLTAIGIFGLVFALGSVEEDAREVVFSDADRAALADGLRLLRPSIAGRTQKGEPYVASAAWALPDGPNPERVIVDTVRGRVTLSDGREARLEANAGALFPREERARLNGAVRATTSDGYVLSSDTAVIDVEGMRIWTETPVDGAGPRGEIRANRMEAVDEGGVIVRFEGEVRMVLWPSEAALASDRGEDE